ncbi:MAG: MFS transporter [Candidatus Latescibacteria bacterium]|nr:MFS transporter [Candidatus Latescibacterota bacterium]
MEEKEQFQSGNVILISFAHLLHDVYSSFLAPILPLLINKHGISYTVAGLLSVIQRLPSLLNPFVGILADKISVRYFVIIAPALTATVMSLLGLAPHYAVLMILCFLMGISATMFHVPAPVMIKHIAGDRIGKGMSYFMLGGELARTLGPLTILGAVSLWGLEGTYRLIPFGIVSSLILYLKFKNIRVSDNFKNRKINIGIRQTFIHLLPFFTNITFVVFFRASMVAALTFFLPTFMTSRGSSLWVSGISLSIVQFAGAAGTLCCGTISDRFGRIPSLIILLTITPVLMLIFMSVNGIFTIPLLIILGFTLFASNPVLLALVQDIDTEHPSFVNGIYMMLTFLVGSVPVVLVGRLGDTLGLETTYRIAAFLAFGSIPFILRLSRHVKKK